MIRNPGNHASQLPGAIRRVAALSTTLLVMAGGAPAAWSAPEPTASATDSVASTGVADRTSVADRPSIRVSWPKGDLRGQKVRVRVDTHGAGRVRAVLVTSQGQEAERRTSKRRFQLTFTSKRARNAVQLKLYQDYRLLDRSAKVFSPHPDRKVARRAYGDGPVRVTQPGQPLGVRFRGHKRQLVSYDIPAASQDRMRLMGPRGPVKPLAANAASDVWRLPTTGTYTLRADPCREIECYARAVGRLQLRRLHGRPVSLDGRAIDLRAGRRRADVGLVRPKGQRVLLRRTAGSQFHLAVPGIAKLIRAKDSRLVIRKTGIVESWIGWSVSQKEIDTRRATYLIVPRTRHTSPTVRASTAAVSDLVVDGPQVSGAGSPQQERAFRFTGTAGTLIYPREPLDYDQARLETPDGAPLTPYDDGAAWLLPTTGVYHLYRWERMMNDPISVRLRQALEIGSMEPGDPPVTFPAPDPGQWSFARIPTDTWEPTTLMATAVTATGPWKAVLAPVWSWRPCTRESPTGCGFRTYAAIDQTTQTSPVMVSPIVGPHVLVFRPAQATSGSVDLALTAP